MEKDPMDILTDGIIEGMGGVEFLETVLKIVVKKFVMKNKEYSRGGDKFSNFIKAGALDGESPERALKGMWKKHVVSICDMVEDIDRDNFCAREDVWLEKITDNIVYSILLYGLVDRRLNNE